MIIEDLDARADLWAGALCAPVKPAVVGAGARKAYVRALDLPFRTDSASVQMVKDLCQRCPLTLQCAVEGIGAEYGVWAGELHEPELDEDETLGAGVSA